MPKFLISTEEVRTFEFHVEADTLEEAFDKVNENSSIYVEDEVGNYMDGSFRIHEEFCHDNNNVIKSDLGYWSDVIHNWLTDLHNATIYNSKPEKFPDAPNVIFARYSDLENEYL